LHNSIKLFYFILLPLSKAAYFTTTPAANATISEIANNVRVGHSDTKQLSHLQQNGRKYDAVIPEIIVTLTTNHLFSL